MGWTDGGTDRQTAAGEHERTKRQTDSACGSGGDRQTDGPTTPEGQTDLQSYRGGQTDGLTAPRGRMDPRPYRGGQTDPQPHRDGQTDSQPYGDPQLDPQQQLDGQTDAFLPAPPPQGGGGHNPVGR